MTTPAQQDSLPGRGLSQHPFLYCGEWQQRGKSEQVMYIVRGGQIVWSYSIPAKEEFGDCTMLSNGNIVFSRRLSASEVTPDKKVVWQYDAPPKTEIHTAQPIGKDRVLIMQNVVQLIEVTPDKKVVWALKNWNFSDQPLRLIFSTSPVFPRSANSGDEFATTAQCRRAPQWSVENYGEQLITAGLLRFI